MLDCLTRDSSNAEHSKDKIIALEAIHFAVEKLRDLLTKLDTARPGEALPPEFLEDQIKSISEAQKEIGSRLDEFVSLPGQDVSGKMWQLGQNLQILEVRDVRRLPGGSGLGSTA